MKAILSILLGIMLLTSLVGVSYASPIMQPSGNDTCSPNSSNYNPGDCGAHQGGNAGDPHPQCPQGQKDLGIYPDKPCVPQ